MLHKTLIRLIYMEVNVGPAQKNGNMLRIFEGRILRMIYGPIRDNGIWRQDITMSFMRSTMNWT
jgi:hypothetical protein